MNDFRLSLISVVIVLCFFIGAITVWGVASLAYQQATITITSTFTYTATYVNQEHIVSDSTQFIFTFIGGMITAGIFILLGDKK